MGKNVKDKTYTPIAALKVIITFVFGLVFPLNVEPVVILMRSCF